MKTALATLAIACLLASCTKEEVTENNYYFTDPPSDTNQVDTNQVDTTDLWWAQEWAGSGNGGQAIFYLNGQVTPCGQSVPGDEVHIVLTNAGPQQQVCLHSWAVEYHTSDGEPVFGPTVIDTTFCAGIGEVIEFWHNPGTSGSQYYSVQVTGTGEQWQYLGSFVNGAPIGNGPQNFSVVSGDVVRVETRHQYPGQDPIIPVCATLFASELQWNTTFCASSPAIVYVEYVVP